MTKNLPAKKYEIFQTLFEQHVSIVQEQVRRVEAMRPIYNVVRDVMLLVDLPNDQTPTFGTGYVMVKVVAAEHDTLAKFKDIAAMIGARLLALDLHHSGEPMTEIGGHWHDIEFRWYCDAPSGPKRSQLLKIVVECPASGLRDLEWETTSRVLTIQEYKGVPRNVTHYGAHPTLQVVGADDIAQGLAELL
jgi:hypothetical protein